MSTTKTNTEKKAFEREVWGLAQSLAGKLREAQDIMRAELRDRETTSRHSMDGKVCCESAIWLKENIRNKLIEITHENSTELRHDHSIIMVKLIDAALADIDFDSVNSMTWHLPEMQ